MGHFEPQAAARGARIIETLSPIPTGGVFVDFCSGNIGEIEDSSAASHGAGEFGSLR